MTKYIEAASVGKKNGRTSYKRLVANNIPLTFILLNRNIGQELADCADVVDRIFFICFL